MIILNKFWTAIRRRALVWDTFTTTVWSTLGKGVAFLIPFFIAAWFGVSEDTDAFFFAYGVVFYFSFIICPVLQTVIVPYIVEIRNRDENVSEFIGRIFGASVVIFLFFVGVFVLIGKPGLRIITNFDVRTINLVYTLSLEVSPILILSLWSSTLRGSLNAYKRFALPAVSPAFRAVVNLSIIYFLKNKYGIHSIMWGYVMGELLVLIILLIYIKRLKIFNIRDFSLKFDPTFKEFLKTSSYQLVGLAAIGLTPLINKTMATWLGIGSVSLFDYAYKLYMIPNTFMVAGLMVTLLSHWSIKYYEEYNQTNFKYRVNKAVKFVFFISLSLMLFLILFRYPLVQIAYGRGKFTADKIKEVSNIFLFFLFGFMPNTIAGVYVRYFITMKHTKIYLKVSLARNLVILIFNLLFLKSLGLKGLALSTTIVSVFEASMYGLAFRRKVIIYNREEKFHEIVDV